MAATAPGPKKQRVDWNLDKSTYDNFVRTCSHKGYAPQVMIEKLIQKYNQTGQI